VIVRVLADLLCFRSGIDVEQKVEVLGLKVLIYVDFLYIVLNKFELSELLDRELIASGEKRSARYPFDAGYHSCVKRGRRHRPHYI
jgi:hypothetical protein